MASSGHFSEWQPVRLYAEGLQPRLGKHWNAQPAWGATAIYPNPDAQLAAPAGLEETCAGYGERFVYWNRHIDRRQHIEWGICAADRPRAQCPSVGDTDREWEILIEHRDRYLQEAGLTLASPQYDIAKCLADTFLCDRHFKDKPMCETYSTSQRALTHAIDGLLYKSHCVGCAVAFAAMANSCGMPARNLGVGAHWVAEVRIDGKWHYVENTGRHEANRGLGSLFTSNHMQMYLDPGGEHGNTMSADYPAGLYRRDVAQYHNFTLGSWQDIPTLRFATSNCYALYPECSEWGIKTSQPRRLPIVTNDRGFYHSGIHEDFTAELHATARRDTPAAVMDAYTSYLYHPLRPGEKLRDSIWLDDSVSSMDGLEIVLTFGRSRDTDYGEATGRNLILSVGRMSASLAELGAWPLSEGQPGRPLHATVTLPANVLDGNAVNWIVLENRSDTTFQMPFVPAAMEPYVAPLYSETSDRYKAPRTFATTAAAQAGA